MYSANCTTRQKKNTLLALVVKIDYLKWRIFSHLPVSPASPLKAIKLWVFNVRVLSSVALRIVGPRMAAFDEAIIVKSLPDIPRRTSIMSDGGYEDRCGLVLLAY